MHYAPYRLSIEIVAGEGELIGPVYRLASTYDDIRKARADAAELFTMIADANTIAIIDVFDEIADIYDAHEWQPETAYDIERL